MTSAERIRDTIYACMARTLDPATLQAVSLQAGSIARQLAKVQPDTAPDRRGIRTPAVVEESTLVQLAEVSEWLWSCLDGPVPDPPETFWRSVRALAPPTDLPSIEQLAARRFDDDPRTVYPVAVDTCARVLNLQLSMLAMTTQ